MLLRLVGIYVAHTGPELQILLPQPSDAEVGVAGVSADVA